MSNYVFVIDSNKTPLSPCKPSKARQLLKAKKAAVFRRYPFTIILFKEVSNTTAIEPITLKIDPGSKITGLALLQGNKVIWGGELKHRGHQIRTDLERRRNLRSNRRNRKTRYRKARFLNRTKPKGWLPPSLKHRVFTTITWVNRLRNMAPINAIFQELVRFDLQKIENPEIFGIEYQQGRLHGYEVKEYLLIKWDRKCTYCQKDNIPLQVEHVVPKSKGGSNRISNLCLACEKCNQKKGSQNIEVFLKTKPGLLKKIKSQLKTPLKDAAAVNITRWALYEALKATGLPITISSGGITKFNRINLSLPKTHWIDAACVGRVTELILETNQPLNIIGKGWGNRRMTIIDKYGFPRKGYRAKQKVKDWSTGDIVDVIDGKYRGLTGKRVAGVRVKGGFDIIIDKSKKVSVSKNHIKLIYQRDGYDYKFN